MVGASKGSPFWMNRINLAFVQVPRCGGASWWPGQVPHEALHFAGKIFFSHGNQFCPYSCRRKSLVLPSGSRQRFRATLPSPCLRVLKFGKCMFRCCSGARYEYCATLTPGPHCVRLWNLSFRRHGSYIKVSSFHFRDCLKVFEQHVTNFFCLIWQDRLWNCWLRRTRRDRELGVFDTDRRF